MDCEQWWIEQFNGTKNKLEASLAGALKAKNKIDEIIKKLYTASYTVNVPIDDMPMMVYSKATRENAELAQKLETDLDELSNELLGVNNAVWNVPSPETLEQNVLHFVAAYEKCGYLHTGMKVKNGLFEYEVVDVNPPCVTVKDGQGRVKTFSPFELTMVL